MPKPLFTVVTVAYNSEKWIRQAINSVLASEFAEFEYLICDDCSTDNSWDIIQSYKDERIKIFRHHKNRGEYQNRNFALEHSSGQYLLFVDGDDELFADTLGKLAGYIYLYPLAGSVWGVPKNDFYGKKLPLLLQPAEIIKWIFLANIRIAHIGFAETLFKTSLLKSLGGFSTKFISGDSHMKKLCALEAPVLIIPGGLIFWRVSQGQASSRLLVDYNGFKNNVAIDNDFLARMKYRELEIPATRLERNIRIRNIKLLFKHTFRKGRIIDGLRLFGELDFRVRDLQLLLKKGDYSYYQQLKNEYGQ